MKLLDLPIFYSDKDLFSTKIKTFLGLVFLGFLVPFLK